MAPSRTYRTKTTQEPTMLTEKVPQTTEGCFCIEVPLYKNTKTKLVSTFPLVIKTVSKTICGSSRTIILMMMMMI